MRKCREGLVYILLFCACICSTGAEPVTRGSLSIDIDKAGDMALRNSMELKSARFQLQSARRKQQLSVWTHVPSLDVNYSDSRTARYNAIDTGSVNLSSTLSVPVSRGGRDSLQKELQRISLDIQNVLLNNSENEIRDMCYSLFHETHILALKIESLYEVEKIATHHYIIAQKEYELGKITEINLIETHLNVSSLSQQIYSAETTLIQKDYSLKKILGIDAGIPLVLISAIDESYTGIPVIQALDILKAHAQQKNMDILKSRFSVEQQRISNRISNSSWIPNINLQGSFQMSGENYPLQNPSFGIRALFEFPFELIPFNFSVGITTSPDIEYGRSYSSGIKSPPSLDPIVDRQLTRLSLLLAVEQNKAVINDILFNLDQLVLNYERARQEQKLVAEKMSIQRRKIEVSEKQLEIGQITRMDYLEAENELMNTHLDLLTGVLSIILTEREIERASGMTPGRLSKFGVVHDTE